MKYRIAVWAGAGLLVAGWWAIYFANANKDISVPSMIYALIYLTQPIALLGRHFPISLYWVLFGNTATYGLAGLFAETLRRRVQHST